MKGILTKKINGIWVVRVQSKEQHECSSVLEHGVEYPLHLQDTKNLIDTYEINPSEGKEVEFEIVTEWENGEVGVNGLTYAKLIDVNVKAEQKKLISEIMQEDEKDGLYDVKKQTAVEWLENNLYKSKIPAIILVDILELINQAKEMEKEQIIKAHGDEQSHLQDDGSWKRISAEQYYNETYNK